MRIAANPAASAANHTARPRRWPRPDCRDHAEAMSDFLPVNMLPEGPRRDESCHGRTEAATHPTSGRVRVELIRIGFGIVAVIRCAVV